MIFLIRFITATALFAFLGKANVWLTPASNVILAIGYRFFLILSPLFDRIAGTHAITLALAMTTIGAALFCSNSPLLLLLGALLVSIGFSVSGYLIKAEASESPKGAAHNKIALNAGSLASGLVLLITFIPKKPFFICASLLFLITVFISYFTSQRKNRITTPVSNYSNVSSCLIWTGLGIAIGIKFFGILSVLPQYLLAHQNQLPSWYGITLFVNSGIIILFQLPIIHWIENLNVNNFGSKMTLLVMMLGMFIIAFPSLLYAQTFTGALIWTSLLAIIECFASYLDVSASRAGCLFIKEISVGLGAGLAVLLSRTLPTTTSSIALGGVGLVATGCAYLYLFKNPLSEKPQ